MYKSNDKKGFTLIEILASIAILAVVILLVTISYSKIRKNTLNKQYDNLRTLIEQVSIKYAAKTGSYNFFVQDLINEDYLEPDDEDKIYDPRNKTPLNCHLVTISDEEPISATLHEEDHTTNGLCDSSDVDGYSSLLTLSAKLANSNTVYTPTSTVNSSSVYPLIYDGWTKSNLDITADLSQITDSLDYSHIVWNNIPENITYYPDVTFTTDESLIYDDFYYADLYLSNDQRYQARIKYKMDNEKPVIYHDKTTMSKYTKADEWVKSRVIIMYATDKDGVGLDRVYIGPRSCSDLLTDSSMGQAAVPGLVQTYTYTGEVGEAGINANVCAVDKLGNLADSGTIFVSKIDSLPPNVVANTYLYNETSGTNPDLYTTGSLGQVTNADINVASYHSASDGWTNVGHFYKFSVTDGGSGLPAGDVAIFYSNTWGSYSLINVLSYVSPITPSSSSTDTTKIYGAGISGKGHRIGKFYVCDKLDNCRTINVTNEKIDKDKPSTPSMNFVYKSWTAYTSNTWTNQDLYAARSKGTAADNAPSSTDQGSGVLKYQIKYPDNPNGTKDYIDYSYNKNDSMYFMNTQGTTSRVFRAIDKAGNISEERTVIGKIDKTKPTVSVGAYSYDGSQSNHLGSTTYNALQNYNDGANLYVNSGGYLKGVTFRIDTADALSDIKNAYWKWDTEYNPTVYATTIGDQSAITTATRYTDFTGSGQRKGQVVVEDNAGNTITVNVYARVDMVKPTCGAITNQGSPTNWVNTNRNITVACDDNTGDKGGSGCTKSTFSNDFGAERAEGTITISDKAGNTRDCTVGVYIDKTAPTVSIKTYDYNANDGNHVGTLYLDTRTYPHSTYGYTHDINVIGGSSYTNFKTFEVTASDSASGVENYVQWYRDRKADNNYSSSQWPTTLTGFDTGTLTYYNDFNVNGCRMAKVIICDNASNCTTVTVKAKIGSAATCNGAGSESGSGGDSNSGTSTCNLPSSFTAAFHNSSTGLACPKGIGDLREWGRDRRFGCGSKEDPVWVRSGNVVDATRRGNTCATYSGGSYVTGTVPKKLYHDIIDNLDYYDRSVTRTSYDICNTIGYFKTHSSTYAFGYAYYYDSKEKATYYRRCTGYRNGTEFAAAYGTSHGTGSSNYYFCCE